jgi:ribonuclease III
MVKQFSEFEKRIGITFRDASLLRRAFTHRSYVNEHPAGAGEHNERLEFLGDAVLELAVTDALFQKYPETNEGELTSYRAALVNADSLAGVATALGMETYLLLSRGEKKSAGRARQYILANAFEALIGAIYLDLGYAAAAGVIGRYVLPAIEEIVAKHLWRDAKSFFQERAQEQVGLTPTYEVLKEEGPDHDKHFVVGVYLDEELVASGKGPSKQVAEQQAAERALEAKAWE